MNTLVQSFLDIEKETIEYNHIIGLLYYDELTSSEKDCVEAKSKTMSYFTGVRHNLQVGERTNRIVDALMLDLDGVSKTVRDKVSFWKRNYDFERSIDKKTFSEYMGMIHMAEMTWRIAKRNNDFSLVMGKYNQILKSQIEFANNYDSTKEPYDVILDRYEPGINQSQYDAYFEIVKQELIPLIKKIKSKNILNEVKPIYKQMDLEVQKKLSCRLMDILCLTPSYCSIGETEHPFTIKLCRNDIRITTKYHNDDFLSSFYTVLHEGGHALYEHNMDDKFDGSCLCEGASMGIHESQSRFFENQIGRNKFFLDYITTILNDEFGFTFDKDELYIIANQVFPMAIRTEADELTYPIHIIIRYEIEKELFSGKLKMSDAPAVWRKKYKNYLDVDITDDRNGILQDSHWSGGSFGYFPSYFIGSAYAAQLMYFMERDLNVRDLLSTGNLCPVIGWLENKVHSIGPLMNPSQIIMNACGEGFSIKYYIDYLKNKYSELI